jgi:hypothetical protein
MRRSGAVALALAAVFSVREARSAHGLLARIGPPEVMSERFTGVAVTLFLDKRVVESWLPEGLSLAESPYAGHPVIVLYGTQRGLARHKRITVYPRFGRSFHETFVAIPYLRLQGCAGQEPVFHFVRLYVDSPRAASQGIRRFGWPKICTAIDVQDQTYRILGGPTGTLFEGRADCDRGEPVPAECASLGEIRAMLSQPLVLKHRGCFDRYDFDLHLDSATIRSVPAEVRIHEGFMPGLAPTTVKTPGIQREAFGAFTIDCRITKTPCE